MGYPTPNFAKTLFILIQEMNPSIKKEQILFCFVGFFKNPLVNTDHEETGTLYH